MKMIPSQAKQEAKFYSKIWYVFLVLLYEMEAWIIIKYVTESVRNMDV